MSLSPFTERTIDIYSTSKNEGRLLNQFLNAVVYVVIFIAFTIILVMLYVIQWNTVRLIHFQALYCKDSRIIPTHFMF